MKCAPSPALCRSDSVQERPSKIVSQSGIVNSRRNQPMTGANGISRLCNRIYGDTGIVLDELRDC